MFFKKKKEEPIFLDCYTASEFAYNYAKIDYSHKYFPEWWKAEVKFNEDGGQTIKNCTAFVDYYSKGIVIPLWGEVEINVNPIGSEGDIYTWKSSNMDFNLHEGSHSQNQWSGFANKNKTNIKFISPWLFKTREMAYFTWTQPTWSQPETFNGLTALPGVMQYKSQMITNINYVVEQNEKTQNFNFQPLTPMAILHPMTERKIEIRCHFISKEKYKTMTYISGSMLFGHDEAIKYGKRDFHINREKFWKKTDEINKCPFE